MFSPQKIGDKGIELNQTLFPWCVGGPISKLYIGAHPLSKIRWSPFLNLYFVKEPELLCRRVNMVKIKTEVTRYSFILCFVVEFVALLIYAEYLK